jgi:hypothetical protein
MLRPMVGLLARTGVGLTLLSAVLGKLTYAQPTPVGGRVGLGAFEDALIQHDIIPIVLIPSAARSVVIVELCLGVWLLSHLRPRLASLLAFALLVSFSAYLIAVYAHHGEPSCGCFGVVTGHSLAATLVRNALLITAAIFGSVWDRLPGTQRCHASPGMLRGRRPHPTAP